MNIRDELDANLLYAAGQVMLQVNDEGAVGVDELTLFGHVW